MPFYGFRIMVLVGFLSVVLMLWTLRAWTKKRLSAERIGSQKMLLYAWMAAAPLNYLAMEAGWVTREVGRQPYIVYGFLRTSESASALPAGAGLSLFAFAAVYLVLLAAFCVFGAMVLARGPVHKPPVI